MEHPVGEEINPLPPNIIEYAGPAFSFISCYLAGWTSGFTVMIIGGGHWGLGTDEGDDAYDLMDALFAAAAGRASVDWRDVLARAKRPRLHDAAAQLLVERAAALVVQPRVGAKSYRPALLDTAGAVLIFLKHRVKLSRMALRLAEVALERELLPEVLENGNAGREARVRAELRLVRSKLST
jgi:hypothetical protein